MFYNAKGNIVMVDGVPMDYVVFGNGEIPLVILPGLGDSLQTVRKLAIPLSIYYRKFAKDFKIYIFSRKTVIHQGYSTIEMASDLMNALYKLRVDKFFLMGISQGGMIAQHLAIQYPEAVKKLVLGASVSRPNDISKQILSHWIKLAEDENYKSLAIETCENTYSQKKLKKYRMFYPIMCRIGKPKDFNRFIIQANACLTHNAYANLENIKCPTLIIGGSEDKIVGENASGEMAEKIKCSKLIMYDGLGHGVFEESKDFNEQVRRFLLIS